MKKIVLAAYAVCCMYGVSAQAAISADECLCTDSINVDSGNDSKKCAAHADSGDDCSCSGTANMLGCSTWGMFSGSYGSCPGSYMWSGEGATGLQCCVYDCMLTPPTATEMTQIEATTEPSLEGVFGDQMQDRADAFFGVVNDTNRSPSAGRGKSVTAKLDACVGHGNTTNMTGLLDCMSNYCPDSNKNSYCYQDGTNNGSTTSHAVCKDRCECQFNSANCENL